MNAIVSSGAPAHDVRWFLKAQKSARVSRSDSKTIAIKAIGSTPDGVIVGVGASAGSPNKLDLDGEFFSKADLVRMAQDFCSSRDRAFKANHQKPLECDLVSSWAGCPVIREDGRLRTLKADETLTDAMNVVAINIEKGKETHWFVGVKPRDPALVELAAKGGIAGFSVGVLATRKEV